jgi:predicted esterase
MKKFLVIVVLNSLTTLSHAQLSISSVVTPSNGTVHFYQFKPSTYRSSGAGNPLIISLHGVGEQGNGTTEITNVLTGGIPLLLSEGATMQFTYAGHTEAFVVLAPQLPKGAGWQDFYVDAMVQYGIANLNVDPNRIFLTGYSLGGVGVWQYATSSPANAAKLAGIAPISAGFPSSPNYCDIAQNQLATWAYHSADDNVYGCCVAQQIINNINICSPLNVPAVDTTYPDGAHAIWNPRVFDTTNNTHYPNLYQWMLKVSRGLDPATNLAPVPVIAGGPVINLTTPVKVKDFPVLDGTASHDDDDIIMDYLWAQTGGTTVNLPRAQWPVTTVTDPAQRPGFSIGSYHFELRVKDYLTKAIYNGVNHTQFANLTVNIALPASGHSAPATDAGGTINIPGTQTELKIIGQAMAYAPSIVTSYGWTQLSGPQGAGPAGFGNFNGTGTSPWDGGNAIRFYNLVSGTYTFQFSAHSNFSGSGIADDIGSDILTVIKASSVLPVTYSYFNGQNQGNKNVLNWATTTEINSARFDVLRSTDGINFSIVGSLTAKGNSSAISTYSFDDNNIPLGLTYYRLSQVDKDGQRSLSQTISVVNTKTGLFVEKYPNPVHDNLNVIVQGTINGTTMVVIADMQGKTILQQQWLKDQPMIKKVINVSSLQNGIYQMILITGQEKQVSSFVKY